MSDFWQGPGWRRAEDGKWYPDPNWVDPDAPPPPAAPLPPPPAAPFTPPAAPGAPSGASPTPPPPPPAPPPVGSSPVGGLPPPPPANAYPPSAGYGYGYGYGYGSMPAPPQPLSGKLAGWLQGLFWVAAGAAVICLLTAVNTRRAFETYMAPSGGFDDLQSWRDADGLFAVTNLLNVVVRLALLVVMIVWSWKAWRAAASLAPGPRKWGIGWTIGAWFVPCAAIILPKLVLDETEKIASAPRVGGTAAGWKATTTSVIGWAWWILFVASTFVATRGNFFTIDFDGQGSLDRGEISGYYGAFVVGFLLAAASAVCGVAYVRRVSSRLSAASLHASGAGYAHGAAGRTTSPTVMGGPSVASVPNAAVDTWATATAQADVFCEICREPLAASSVRCPRCGKRREPTAPTGTAMPPAAPGLPVTPTAPPTPTLPPPPAPTPWGVAPPPPVPGSAAPGPPAPPGRPETPTGWAPYPPVPGAKPPKESAGAGKIVGTVIVTFLLLVVVCLLAVTFLGRTTTDPTATDASSSSSGSAFSDVEQKAFVDSCISGGGTRSQCQCFFTVVETMYSHEEFVALESDIERTGTLPSELMQAMRVRCS